MRQFDTATAATFADQEGFAFHLLVWIVARNRETGEDEAIGLWTGEDVAQFTVDGETRTYYACGNALEVDPIVMQPGYDVRSQRITLGGINEAVQQAVRNYEPRFCPVELHRAVFSISTHELVAAPHVMFRGSVDELNLPVPEKGGTATGSMTIVSSARAGTRTLSLRKSDEAQQAAHPGDAFRQYIAISTAVPVWWGELRSGQGGGLFPDGGNLLKERLGLGGGQQ